MPLVPKCLTRYWDYTLDSEKENPYDSPVFSTDPEIGFGNGGSVAINELGGRAGGYIVENGAFAGYRVGILLRGTFNIPTNLTCLLPTL